LRLLLLEDAFQAVSDYFATCKTNGVGFVVYPIDFHNPQIACFSN